MLSRRRQQQRPITSIDWLQLHRERFLKNIADQGYCDGTLTHYSAATSQFCKEVVRRGLRRGQLVSAVLSNVCTAVLKGQTSQWSRPLSRCCSSRPPSASGVSAEPL